MHPNTSSYIAIHNLDRYFQLVTSCYFHISSCPACGSIYRSKEVVDHLSCCLNGRKKEGILSSFKLIIPDSCCPNSPWTWRARNCFELRTRHCSERYWAVPVPQINSLVLITWVPNRDRRLTSSMRSKACMTTDCMLLVLEKDVQIWCESRLSM